jgi:glyoxylase-like metal-dependent hydrolase (beta-lactamase superfamily II)
MEKTFNADQYSIEVLYHIGAYENSIHFIVDKKTKQCAIVDPAWEADLFIQRIEEKGYTLTDIWITHWHGDHTNAVDEMANKTGAKITAGINELPFLDIENTVHTVQDGDVLKLGETEIKVIETPGHTAGGVCYLLDDHLIAGDTLFVYGVGICCLSGSDPVKLFHSLNKLKTQVADDITLLCGHDYGSEISTTLAQQKKANPFLLIEDLETFVRYRMEVHDVTRAYPMSPMTLAEVNALL